MAPQDAKAKAGAKKAPKKEKVVDDAEAAIPKVEAPDRTDFDAKSQKIQDDIDKLQKKQKGLNDKIGERSGGKEEFFAKKAELRAQLDEFSKHMDALTERKNKINEQFGAAKREGQEMKANLQKMKKSVGYTNEEDIDARIAEIEYSMWSEHRTLKEEKKLMAEIQELKKCKPKVSQVHKLEESLGNRSTGGDMKEQLQLINAELFEWREKKRGISEKMTELTESRKSQLGDLPDIIAERDGLGEQIRAKIQERNALRDEFRQLEKAHKDYLYEVRKVRQERAAKEREERQKEYNQQRLLRKAEQLDEQPYTTEITMIEQTIAFCKSLTATKSAEVKQEKAEVKHDNPDGSMVLLSKKDRDEEVYFAATKSKKKGKAGKKADAGSGSKPIKHNVETFQLFEKLKLDAPITTDDIPACLEKLEVQLEDYKQKVLTWEEKREEMKRKILAGEPDSDIEAEVNGDKAEDSKEETAAAAQEDEAEEEKADEAEEKKEEEEEEAAADEE